MQAVVLLVFLAPDAPDAAAKAEIARLDGAWVVASAELKGKKLDRSPIERVVFAAGKAGADAGKEKGAAVLSYKLDPGKTPKVIEATAVGGEVGRKGVVGIYEVGADTLKLCLVPSGLPPPAAFRTGPDDGALLLELRRAKR